MQPVSFTFATQNGVTWVMDLGGKMTVTNGVETVLVQLRAMGADMRLPILYRDSRGRWDQILTHPDGTFKGFYVMNARCRATALLEMRRHNQAANN